MEGRRGDPFKTGWSWRRASGELRWAGYRLMLKRQQAQKLGKAGELPEDELSESGMKISPLESDHSDGVKARAAVFRILAFAFEKWIEFHLTILTS